MAALIFFVALNLRPAIIAVGPLLSQIGADLQWGETLLGLLGALPLFAFAFFSFFVRFLTARFNTDNVLIAALFLLSAGCLIRSFCGNEAIWIGTVIVGGSIAVGNVLAPAIVKRDYPLRLSAATGAYSAFVTSGSAIAGLTASACADFLGGWKPALALWALPAFIAAILWFIRTYKTKQALKANDSFLTKNEHLAQQSPLHTEKSPNVSARPQQAPEQTKSLWKKPSTWFVTLFMGIQSAAFYTFCNWLPSIATTFGFTATEAGTHLFIFQVLGIFSGLLIPHFMFARGNQIVAGLLASTPLAIASAGWLFFPQLSLIWSIFGGIGQGASLVVALTLISLRGTTHAETVALSGIAQSLGYLLAACGPFVFGFFTEITHGFSVPLALMLTLALIQCALAVFAGRQPKTTSVLHLQDEDDDQNSLSALEHSKRRPQRQKK